jgi:PAS domain S-box-containing protein
LRARLAEVEETLRAIRSGEVDAMVVPAKGGPQIFSLQSADHPYRLLIESMNEGALTLTPGKLILYANQRFARMVRSPLEQVMGGSFSLFISPDDRVALRRLVRRADPDGAALKVQLKAADGSHLPVQVSIRTVAGGRTRRRIIGMVVTDLTESHRTEGLLRALAQRVVDGLESERGRVALKLHDNITQLLCGVLFRSQSLTDRLARHDGPARDEALKLSELLSQTVGEVERISQDLRPSILDHMGLTAVLREATARFASRTGVPVKLAYAALAERLPADTELALYRILQDALNNVEQHARAQHVTVRLSQPDHCVVLTIADDGVGFNPLQFYRRQKGRGDLGLLGMRERASQVGGILTIKSTRRAGTELAVRIPLPARLPATGSVSTGSTCARPGRRLTPLKLHREAPALPAL